MCVCACVCRGGVLSECVSPAPATKPWNSNERSEKQECSLRETQSGERSCNGNTAAERPWVDRPGDVKNTETIFSRFSKFSNMVFLP